MEAFSSRQVLHRERPGLIKLGIWIAANALKLDEVNFRVRIYRYHALSTRCMLERVVLGKDESVRASSG